MSLPYYQERAGLTMNWGLAEPVQFGVLAMGIYGELAELSEVTESCAEGNKQIAYEIGDVFWYIANLCSLLGVNWEQFFPIMRRHPRYSRLALIARAFTQGGLIADCLKKHVGQGHEIDRMTIEFRLRELIETMTFLLDYYKLDLWDVLYMNIQKLEKRYPNGFSTEKSVFRGQLQE